MSTWLESFAAFGDGIAGIVAIGALLAAIAAAIAAGRTFNIERKREHKSEQRERREQAALISAWCATRIDQKHPTGRGLRAIIVRNASHAPAYDVRVSSSYAKKARSTATEIAPAYIAVVPPGEYYIGEGDEGHAWAFPEPLAGHAEHVVPVMNNPRWIVTALEFTDAHGQTWCRDSRGRLLAVDGAEAR